MKFAFQIGEREVHEIRLSANQFLGYIRITVDGQTVVFDYPLVSLTLVRSYEFIVGEEEKHRILIQKNRKLLIAFVRKQTYSAYVDGKLVCQHRGY